MNISSDSINYQRIAEAIDYISLNFKSQPDLNKVAEKIHLSPFHFQRLFTEWAGVSPKKFIQYLSVGHAKSLLKDHKVTLFDAAFETGLSGTGRLHDLFINIEGMTPGEFKNGGEQLSINYSFAESIFGNIIIASTLKGICHLAFVENEQDAFAGLQKSFPKASFHQVVDALQAPAIHIFNKSMEQPEQIKIHVKGTPFQLKVWEALLKIPAGELSTYGSIASGIHHENASRAVGTAIGSNPIAFLIPCHRVIQSTGNFSGYRWGPTRKAAMIGWESAAVFGE